MGSLSVLSNNQNSIKKLISVKDSSAVQVWICDSGAWRPVTLDNYFPVGDNDRAKYARPNSNKGLWQMYAEKAYAKIYKGYKNLHLGHSSSAMRDLTGFPTSYIDLQNPTEAYDKLSYSLKKENIITGSSLPKSEKIDPKMRLVAKHCYAILRTKSIRLKGKLK